MDLEVCSFLRPISVFETDNSQLVVIPVHGSCKMGPIV